MVAVIVVGGAATAVVVVVDVEAWRGWRACRAHRACALQGGELVVLWSVQRRVLVPLLLLLVQQVLLVLLRRLAAPAAAAVLGRQGVLVQVQLPGALGYAARSHGYILSNDV